MVVALAVSTKAIFAESATAPAITSESVDLFIVFVKLENAVNDQLKIMRYR